MVPPPPGCWVSSRKGVPPARGPSETSGSPGPILCPGLAGRGQAWVTVPPPDSRGPSLSSRPAFMLPLRPQVKQLRLEREREKAMREQELEMLQREKEAEHFKTWEEQEDSFHLQQAKLRCAGEQGPGPACRHTASPLRFPPLLDPDPWSPALPQGLCTCCSRSLEPTALAAALCPLDLCLPPLWEDPPRPSLWHQPPLCVHSCHCCTPVSCPLAAPVLARGSDLPSLEALMGQTRVGFCHVSPRAQH